MASEPAALLFPGQGAQSETMLDALAAFDAFRPRYDVVCNALGLDLLDEARAGRASVHANLTGSVMTVLASAISLDLLRDAHVDGPFAGTAGYSVGQWTALYAAGSISFEQLIRIVKRRAELMDACAAANPGSMLAVIGVAEAPLEALCGRIRDGGHFVAIANYNAVGQYSLSMAAGAEEIVMREVQALKPAKCIPLRTGGGWHSRLMTSARDGLLQLLESEELRAAAMPVVDNASGDFLPADIASGRERLADQVCQPVRWSGGVETLIARGAARCIEVGYGNMLSKFGFFINRKVRHLTFHTSLSS